jgi:hypothetical protein
LISNLSNFSISQALFEANSKPENMEEIEMFIRYRLDAEGKTSTGIKLRTDTSYSQGTEAYSLRTTQLKGMSRFVNLKNEGDFHETIKAKANQNGSIEITANFNKGSKNIHENFETQFTNRKDFEDAILSLTESELTEYAIKDLLPDLEKEIIKLLNV